ncbi:hypothetical protein AA23498_3133 [Acetobacter nitrogenifigens DSM 23921 = NBRC 105050]|uniref:Uncharacterized protein n=1 Tax=Acetobacter nitrogenifigens DSM 23921 = NBRC 105050 TaxID=1120919 RepID=A0A511X5H5_9PROT|nr:hypothetical protein [Acetobacter nitrogenifigens]GBQ98186.1 hypothetical protein AA23498_3133 [Acetobacter nitrogenifigens DSM 23921 = NBRC 105050]GEN58184.1 hypothetical protein ANI02nite_00680 [Acetobacter nitrogenifigens DSM 23921 = NBRC 105050]
MAAPGANGIVKYAHLIRTRKYVAVISMDNRGGSYFSVTGWSTFIDRKEATPQWIGKNLMKALRTSKDLFMQWGKYPLPQDKIDAERKKSGPLYMEFWGRVREKYGFKDWREAQTKSALVFAEWECEQTDQVHLAASKGRGTSHSAWYSNENHGKVFHASISASDQEFGAVALQALDACQPNYA